MQKPNRKRTPTTTPPEVSAHSTDAGAGADSSLKEQPPRERSENSFGAGAEKISIESILASIDVLPSAREKIERRAAIMPESMRRQYLRAMRGKSPLGAIKAFCRMCVGWQRLEVNECTDPACPLFPLRLGKRQL
jgi:hypothetical protein